MNLNSHEVAPETILADIARVIEAAVPNLRLTPALGACEPITVLFDGEDLTEEDLALAAAGQQIRGLGMGIDFDGEPWGGFERTSADLTPHRWVAFAEQVLSDVQDVVSQATTDPWPEQLVDGRRTQAPGGACLDGRFLYMWFGDREEPLMDRRCVPHSWVT